MKYSSGNPLTFGPRGRVSNSTSWGQGREGWGGSLTPQVQPRPRGPVGGDRCRGRGWRFHGPVWPASPAEGGGRLQVAAVGGGSCAQSTRQSLTEVPAIPILTPGPALLPQERLVTPGWTFRALGWVMPADAAHRSPTGLCRPHGPCTRTGGRACPTTPSLSPRRVQGRRPVGSAPPAAPCASPARAPSPSVRLSPGQPQLPTHSRPHQRPRTPSSRPRPPAFLAHQPLHQCAMFQQHTIKT